MLVAGSPLAASTLQSSAQDGGGGGQPGWNENGLVPPSCCWPAAVTDPVAGLLPPSSRCSRDGGARVCPPRSPVRPGASRVAAAVESLPSTPTSCLAHAWSPDAPLSAPWAEKSRETRGGAAAVSCARPQNGAGDPRLSRFMIYFGFTMFNF